MFSFELGLLGFGKKGIASPVCVFETGEALSSWRTISAARRSLVPE
jgi:hypothetical protein